MEPECGSWSLAQAQEQPISNKGLVDRERKHASGVRSSSSLARWGDEEALAWPDLDRLAVDFGLDLASERELQ